LTPQASAITVTTVPAGRFPSQYKSVRPVWKQIMEPEKIYTVRLDTKRNIA